MIRIFLSSFSFFSCSYYSGKINKSTGSYENADFFGYEDLNCSEVFGELDEDSLKQISLCHCPCGQEPLVPAELAPCKHSSLAFVFNIQNGSVNWTRTSLQLTYTFTKTNKRETNLTHIASQRTINWRPRTFSFMNKFFSERFLLTFLFHKLMCSSPTQGFSWNRRDIIGGPLYLLHIRLIRMLSFTQRVSSSSIRYHMVRLWTSIGSWWPKGYFIGFVV